MKQRLKSDLAPAAPKTVAGFSVRAWTRAGMIAALLLTLLLPFAIKGFLVFQLTLALIYAVAILGLNLLTGFNGQFSLGHSAFYAFGAYTAAILMAHADVAYYWTVPAAGAACFIIGFLFGLPALRLEGLYLALATFALAIAMPQLLKSTPLEPWTGGGQGIVILKPEAPLAP
jgi:branched-chain amino acid transport system permease protein